MPIRSYDGPREFTFILDESKHGQTGAFFEFLELEEDKGQEAVLVILEEPPYATAYKNITNIRVDSKQLVLNTPYGAVAIIVWKFAGGTSNELVLEHYISPEFFRGKEVRMLETQPYLRVVVVDNRTGRSRGFFQFQNLYDFGHFGNQVRSLNLPAMGEKMILARQSIESTMTIKEIRDLASF